jgi:membrane protein implicated in regulation of membrane protease activity
MTQANNKPRSPIAAHPITSAAIAILIAADIFFVLFTPIYARITPKLGNWPFFYWYLIIFMPVTSLVLWLTLRLQNRLEQPPQDPATASQQGGVRS